MDENSNINNQILSEIQEIKTIFSNISDVLTLLVSNEIEDKLSYIFDSSEKILVYKLSDGINSTRDIANKISKSHTTVAKWWKQWEEKYEIIESNNGNSPAKAKYSLVELALIFGKKVEDNDGN